MTDLNRPVKRRSRYQVDDRRRVVVTLMPGDVIGFRLERTRRTWTTTLQACYQMAVRHTVAAERAAKRAGR